MHVRVCVECGEEFRPGVAVCSDCGGALEDRTEGPEGGGAGAPGPRFQTSAPKAEDPIAVASAADARDLVPVADRLRKEGVSVQVGERRLPGDERPRGYEIRIAPSDLTRAAVILQAVLEPGSGISMAVPTFLASPPETNGGHAETGSVPCPACDTEVPPDAAECPACGLGLGASEAE